jgi:hypothetical protein
MKMCCSNPLGSPSCGFTGAGHGLKESHAAFLNNAATTIEKAMGRIERCLQLTTVITAKHRANAT